MRRLAMALGVMATVLFVAGVSAQNKKDFTGKWVVDAEKSGGAQANTGGRQGGNQASPLEIKMDAKDIVITTTRQGQNGPTTSVVTYHLDGSDSKNTPSFGRAAAAGGAAPAEQISNAKWDGDKLVIVTKDTNDKTTYWMDGANLVREVLRGQPGRDGAAPTPTRQYFKKA